MLSRNQNVQVCDATTVKLIFNCLVQKKLLHFYIDFFSVEDVHNQPEKSNHAQRIKE